MNGKILLSGLLGTGAVVSTAVTEAEAQSVQQKPNIIIIYTDDMGVGDLSCLNSGWVATPNIDRLAAEGLVMNNYYSAAPVSSASRVGLTTGMFPMQWGINTFLNTRKANANCEQFDYLDSGAPSMASALKTAGYHTGHFGKWHMGGGRDVDDAPPITVYGFDEYSSTWESPDPDPALTSADWIWSPEDQVKRWNRTSYFVDKTLDFMLRHKGQPCFVNLWPDDMHTPWVDDEESEGKRKTWSSRPNFEGVLAEYDKQIGRLITELEKNGLSENTIIIFTSDNGPAPSFEQLRTNQMRGVKNSLYEGGIRMPFIIRWPAAIEAGKVDNSTVICAVDLLPSLCRIAGAQVPRKYQLSGEDMSQALMGRPQVRTKDIVWDFGRNQYFNFPKEEYHRSPSLAIRRGEWKLLIDGQGGSTELYNLAEDVNETNNVANQNAELVAELTRDALKIYNTRRTPERTK